MFGPQERQRIERKSLGIAWGNIFGSSRVRLSLLINDLVLTFFTFIFLRKYERTKQVAQDLNDREKMVLQDRKTLTESLKMQEARYDKMKSHAMSQLEM